MMTTAVIFNSSQPSKCRMPQLESQFLDITYDKRCVMIIICSVINTLKDTNGKFFAFSASGNVFSSAILLSWIL